MTGRDSLFPARRAFYFGCWREKGHYLWHRGADGTPIKKYDRGESERKLLGGYPHSTNTTKGEIPWGYGLDGGLLKGRALSQGQAVVEQRDGWTALSFWDRSVDSRGGSSSTFVFDALLSPEDALAAAREAFPPIFERFNFDVVLAWTDLTLRCPTCGRRADVCFDHGDVWKKPVRDGTPSELQRMTDDELRAGVNEFTQDDPPPYGGQTERSTR